MEDAGCGVFYTHYFLAVGTSSETRPGDTEQPDGAGQSCAPHRTLQQLPWFHCVVSPTYAMQRTHAAPCDPEKEKSSTLHQGRRPAGSRPAAGLSCWQDTSIRDTRLGSVSQAGCSMPQRRCGTAEVQRAVGGREERVPPCRLALTCESWWEGVAEWLSGCAWSLEIRCF